MLPTYTEWEIRKQEKEKHNWYMTTDTKAYQYTVIESPRKLLAYDVRL